MPIWQVDAIHWWCTLFCTEDFGSVALCGCHVISWHVGIVHECLPLHDMHLSSPSLQSVPSMCAIHVSRVADGSGIESDTLPFPLTLQQYSHVRLSLEEIEVEKSN